MASITKLKLKGNQKGQALIEVLISLAILGIVAVAFLTALTTASAAIIIADERTVAESLTRSELEYVKSSSYDDVNNPPQYSIDPSVAIPGGYSAQIEAVRLDPEGDGTADDDGIQQVTVKVYHQGKLVLTSATYKVNR